MVESADPFPGATNVPLIPTYWADQLVAKLLGDANSATFAKAVAAAPVKTVNGAAPDIFGNVRVNPAQVTPAQLSSVLAQTFEAGDNVKVVVDPDSGRVRINAHTIGSVWTVNGKCGHVAFTKADFGLDRVDNTSDMEKPISNPTRAAINQIISDVNTKIANIRTELTALVNNSLTTIRNEIYPRMTTIENSLAGKADKNHTHPAPGVNDIPGLDGYVRTRVVNRWGNWTPLPLLNGWTGSCYAITDGQVVVFKGTAMPGSSTTFARLPFGFPVPSYAVCYGTHTVSFNVLGGVERRISRMHVEGGTMRLDGYVSMTNGNQLDGAVLYVL